MTIHWWRSGRFYPACGNGSSTHLCTCTAHSYLARFTADPQMYCSECRDLASTEALNYRSDSDRYAELRKLVEAVQIDSKIGTARTAIDALLDWRHR